MKCITFAPWLSYMITTKINNVKQEKVMRKAILLAVLAVLTVSFSFAQDEGKQIVGVSPGFLIRGLRVKYETPIKEKISVGGTLSGYFLATSYPGIQIAPFARYYFKEATDGFYGQFKLQGGFHSAKIIENQELVNKSFVAFGGGIAFGYQRVISKNGRWLFDANIGIRVSAYPPEGDKEDAADAFIGGLKTANWGSMGPGSVFDGLFSICYRF